MQQTADKPTPAQCAPVTDQSARSRVAGVATLWRALVRFFFAGFCLACLNAAASTPVASAPATAGASATATATATASTAFLASLTEQERAWLRAHPVIRVVQDPDWPPIEFADERGQPTGMTKDYLRLIEQRLGQTFEPVLRLSWQEAYARLKRGEIDMTTTVAETPERLAFWAFTKPYMNIPIVIAAQQDVSYIANMHELAGILQKALDSITEAERDEIFRRWLPIRYEHSFNYTVLWQSLAAFAAVVLALALWNRKLSFEIRARKRAQSALKESEERLAITLNSIGDAVVATDPQGRVTRMNPVAERLTGWPLADALGRPLAEVFCIVNAQTRLPEANPVLQVMEHGQVVGRANHAALLARDGQEVQIADSAAPIRDAANAIVGVVLVFSDVTLAHAAARAQRESDERYRTLLSTAMDGFWLVDAQGRLLEVNASYGRMSGYGPQELLGKHIADLDAAETASQTAAHIQRVMALGEDRFETRHRRKDGSVFDVEVSVQYRAIEGEQFMVFVRDISAGKRMEQELQAQRDFATQIIDSVGQGLTVTDVQGRFEYVNPAYARLVGCAPGDLIGKDPKEVTAPEVCAAQDVQRALRQAGQTSTYESLLSHPDGHVTTVSVTAVPRWRDGQFAGSIAVITDLTARKQAELALQASLHDKEALLKEVHHRVKNNLQVVTSLLRLEAGRSAHAPTKAVLAEMQGRIRSMALLHESVYRAGTFAAIDLGAYLRQVATQAFRSLQSSSAAVRLRLELGSVQAGLDQATPGGLLLTELVSNALKHGFTDGRSGEVLVELHAVPGAAPDTWCLRVSDNGVGLPADFAARQQDSLGLQLVASLAQQLGGSLVLAAGADGDAVASGAAAGAAAMAAPTGAVFSVTFAVSVPTPVAITA